MNSLDEQSLRSTMDRALQLTSQDLTELCKDTIADGCADEWRIAAHQYPSRPLDLTDPLFWVNHFTRPDSPVHQAVGRPSGQLSRDFDKVRRLRNGLYHFAFSCDAARARASLFELLRVARACALPVADDIEEVLADIARNQAGETPPRPTLAEAVHAVEVEQQAALLASRQDREHELLADELTRTRDTLEAEVAARDVDARRIAELENEAQRLLRLQQESEIKSRHLEDLHQASLAALPVTRPALSRAVVEYLVSLLRLAAVLEQILSASSTPTEDVEDSLAQLRNRTDALLPVSHLPVPGVIAEADIHQAFTEASAHFSGTSRAALEEVSQRTTALKDEIARRGASPDDEIPDDLEAVFKSIEADTEILEKSTSDFRVLQHAVSSVVESGAAGRAPTAALPAPGLRWTWPRGDEVWILSAAQRRIKRHSEAIGFAERYGPRLEQELASEWLAIRPKGGRVYVDEDGDACTFGPDGEYVYLGRVTRTAA